MTYAQIMKGVPAPEMKRRMEVIMRMNILWDRKQKCDDESKRKALQKKIDQLRRQETSWLKDIAFFLY